MKAKEIRENEELQEETKDLTKETPESDSQEIVDETTSEETTEAPQDPLNGELTEKPKRGRRNKKDDGEALQDSDTPKVVNGFMTGEVVRIKFSAVKYCDGNITIARSDKFNRYVIKDFLIIKNKMTQVLLDNNHYVRIKDIAKIEYR